MYSAQRVKAIAAVLRQDKFSHDSDRGRRLGRWPLWLSWSLILILEAHGLAKHIDYGPNTYGATDLILL